MARTKAGGQKATARNKAKYGADFYAKIGAAGGKKGIITLNTTIVVKVNGAERQYTIVGAQEAEPIKGKISNESPLGQAFMGKKAGDKVQVTVPAGVQIFEIISLI
jgi:transcription elongation GreA/GreB family factor